MAELTPAETRSSPPYSTIQLVPNGAELRNAKATRFALTDLERRRRSVPSKKLGPLTQPATVREVLTGKPQFRRGRARRDEVVHSVKRQRRPCPPCVPSPTIRSDACSPASQCDRCRCRSAACVPLPSSKSQIGNEPFHRIDSPPPGTTAAQTKRNVVVLRSRTADRRVRIPNEPCCRPDEPAPGNRRPPRVGNRCAADDPARSRSFPDAKTTR